MKLGVNTFIWSESFDRTQLFRLENIKAAGFDGIELPLIDPTRARDVEMRRALERNGLECTFCAVVPSGLNTISEDAEIRKKTRQHFETCIEIAAEMGSKLIAGPLYAPVGYLPGRRRTSEEWKHAVGCFEELGPWLERYDVTLALEPLNRYETYFLNTAADGAALCREIGHRRVGMLFDTYHANIEEKSVAEAIVDAGRYLRHFHACENDRGIPGSGHVDWSGVFGALSKVGYDGWLTIESFGFSMGTLSAAASIWRDLAPEPEAIAFNGIKFLKGQVNRASA